MAETKALIEFHLGGTQLSPCKKQKIRSLVLMEAIKQRRNLSPSDAIPQGAITNSIKEKIKKLTVLDKLDGFITAGFSLYGKESLITSVGRWNLKISFLLFGVLLPATLLIIGATFAITWDLKKPGVGELIALVKVLTPLFLTLHLFVNLLIFFGLVVNKTNALLAVQGSTTNKSASIWVHLGVVVLGLVTFSGLFSLFGLIMPLEIPIKWQISFGAIVVYVVMFFVSLFQTVFARMNGTQGNWLFQETLKLIALIGFTFIISSSLGKDFFVGLKDAFGVFFGIGINLWPIGLFITRPRTQKYFRKWFIWNQMELQTRLH